jgi:hypothetical protein
MCLTEDCVLCGSEAHGGLRFDTERYYYPRWVWAGLVVPFPPIIVLALCLIGRKKLDISFSVCERCTRVRRRMSRVALACWVLTAASMLVSVWLENAWILLASAALFATAAALSILANQPLRVSRHDDGVFTVKGFHV